MTDTVAAPARRFRPRLGTAPLRSREYRLLFLGDTISVFGDAFHAVALPWLVYQLGGGAGQLGLVAAGYGVCRLATTPLGGMLSDRIGPWRVMMVSDLGRMLLSVAIAVVATSGSGNFAVIAVLAAAAGLGAGLFQPAAYAITPRLLPADQLAAGNALSSTATYAAGLVGPALAGLLVTVLSPGAAFGVDAVTFAVSAACLVTIGRGLPAVHPPVPAHPGGGRAAAPRVTLFSLVRSSPLLRAILVVTAVANLTVGGLMRVGLPSFASGDLHAGADGFGALLAAFAGGALLGGLVSAGITALPRRGITAMLSGLVMAAAVALVPVVGYSGALAALLVAGTASTITNVLVITVLQLDVPRELLGRAMSAILFAALGLFPVSVAAAGVVVDRYGSTPLFVSTGLLLFVAFSYGLSRREVRHR